jgi:hypothetical protein
METKVSRTTMKMLASNENTTVLDRIREAQAALTADGMVGALAQRYVTRPID